MPPIKWECPVCHTLNDRGNVCSHCGTPRPKKNKSTKSKSGAPSK